MNTGYNSEQKQRPENWFRCRWYLELLILSHFTDYVTFPKSSVDFILKWLYWEKFWEFTKKLNEWKNFIMRRIISRKFSAAAKVNSDREILGVTKNATLKGMALIRVQRTRSAVLQRPNNPVESSKFSSKNRIFQKFEIHIINLQKNIILIMVVVKIFS